MTEKLAMEIITCHLNADFDCLAAMLAAHRLYPEARLVFPGSQERHVRRFLQDSGLIFEFTRLKAINMAAITRLIVVDNRQASRLGPLQQCLNNQDLDIHLYDHHPNHNTDLQGSVEVIREVGSTATIFCQLFQQQQLKIDQDLATLLGLALHEDTGSFTFATTTTADLQAMAWLLEQGADILMVQQYISHELNRDEVGLLHELIEASHAITINTIPITIASLALPEYCDEFALLVRHFMTMENLNVLIAIAAMHDRVFVIARSRIPEVNVGKITMELGGGGHASAASATVKGRSLVQVEDEVMALLNKHVHPPALAQEIMSAPVIAIGPKATIAEANATLIRYNITVLPVLDEGRVIGLISRRDTAKAIFHQLQKQTVATYMTTEFAKVTPNAGLEEIQRIIITNRQRTIPVVKGQKMVGIITRTDLFTLLATDSATLPPQAGEEIRPSTERTRNLATTMAHALDANTLTMLRTIGQMAQHLNYRAFTVGGFVRDLLRGQTNLDFDIVVEGDGIALAKALVAELGGRIRIHEKFNTAKLLLPTGLTVDIATARLEYYDHPAAMPKVESSSIKLDLFRRDFTINAMAIHLCPDKFGILVDYFNSQNDLKDGMIRIIHNLSFVEDPTRIFRAIRFEQRMNFSLGEHTKKQIVNAVTMELFQAHGFRFFQEIKYLLTEKSALAAIKRLDYFKLLKFLHPKLHLTPRLNTTLEQAAQAISWYKLLYLPTKWQPWQVMLLALTTLLKTRDLAKLCSTMEMPERHSNFLINERVTAHRVIQTMKKSDKLRPSAIDRLLSPLSTAGLLYTMASCRHSKGQAAVSSYVTTLAQQQNVITGTDLIALGYQPGPLFKKILARLRAATLDGECGNKEDEIALLQKEFPR